MDNQSLLKNSAPSKSAAPKVLVTGSLTSPEVTDYLRSLLQLYAQNVITAIHSAGAETQFVEASAPQRDTNDTLGDVDALLVLGGADADPAFYGQTSEVDTMYGVDREADQYELDLIRLAMSRNLPVLGICRGVQLINILHGGDLVQEIGPNTIHNLSADNSIMTSHAVTPSLGSRLGEIYNGRTLSVRSGHHQAIGRVGKGLVVVARADDGIIEAVEAEGSHWLIGVQWHPEDPEAPREDLDLLAASFVQAMRVHQRI